MNIFLYRFRMLFAILLLSSFSSAHAAPCVSNAAQLKLARAEFATADAALNVAWKPLKAKLSAAHFAAVLKQQRLWIPYRDAMAAASAAGGVPFVEPASMQQCAKFEIYRADISRSRTKVLQALLAPATASWSGVYQDSFGGTISMDARGDGLHFMIDVVRSSAFHTGQIVGVAQVKGDAAIFRTTTDDYSTDAHDTQPVLVTFSRDANQLQLVTENAQNFGGMRAYFDGDYVRVSALGKTGARDIEAALDNRE